MIFHSTLPTLKARSFVNSPSRTDLWAKRISAWRGCLRLGKKTWKVFFGKQRFQELKKHPPKTRIFSAWRTTKAAGPKRSSTLEELSRGKKPIKTSWWLKQPLWKILRKSKWESFPQGCGVNIPKIFEVSPPRKPTVLPSKWIGYMSSDQVDLGYLL